MSAMSSDALSNPSKRRSRLIRPVLLLLMCLTALPAVFFVIQVMGSLNPFVIGEIRELRLVNRAGQDVSYSIIGDLPGKPTRKWILQQYQTRIPAMPSFHSEHVLLAKDASRLVYFHAETITPSDVWISYESGPEKSISISSTGQLAKAVPLHDRSQLGEISIPEPSSLPDATAEVHSAGSGRNIWVAIVIGFVGLVTFVLVSRLYLKQLAPQRGASSGQKGVDRPEGKM